MVVPLKLIEPEKFLITIVIPELLYLIFKERILKKVNNNLLNIKNGQPHFFILST